VPGGIRAVKCARTRDPLRGEMLGAAVFQEARQSPDASPARRPFPRLLRRALPMLGVRLRPQPPVHALPRSPDTHGAMALSPRRWSVVAGLELRRTHPRPDRCEGVRPTSPILTVAE
jgi:hypothetical protein